MFGSVPTGEPRVEAGPAGGVARVVGLDDLLAVARSVAGSDEVRRTATGFIGYGATKPGDRVLIGVDSQLHHDWVPEIPGVTVPGDYADYARDPARWVYGDVRWRDRQCGQTPRDWLH